MTNLSVNTDNLQATVAGYLPATDIPQTLGCISNISTKIKRNPE
ncbi:hypothetical protein [Candidatus Nitrotoga sp. HW29]|nr:hypothetical protein [Candidatus Nitrotoga sp. HW29]